jgi:hypothetical protein
VTKYSYFFQTGNGVFGLSLDIFQISEKGNGYLGFLGFRFSRGENGDIVRLVLTHSRWRPMKTVYFSQMFVPAD